MTRKYGKKNKIKVNPLAYNIGLIGESGIGKTSTLIEVSEKLVGEDGYMLFSLGKEDAVDAISGAIYEEVPDYDTFFDITEDILENRNTDYKDLKVIIYDTIDQLFEITEDHVIELHNADAKPDKKVSSINGAMGGYGKGQEKVIKLILDRLWELKQVGISYIVVGHTKRKTLNDMVSDDSFEMLTTNMSEKYFNAIKTKLHFLGVASIDRQIEFEKKKQRMGADKEIGKVVGESRIITFRDDNFNIDSKSRFKEIAPQINLSADEFIEVMNEAIRIEQLKDKNSKPLNEIAKEQEKELNEKIEKELEKKKEEVENLIDLEENEKLINSIMVIYSNATDEIKSEMAKYMKDINVSLKKPKTTKTKDYQELLNKFK